MIFSGRIDVIGCCQVRHHGSGGEAILRCGDRSRGGQFELMMDREGGKQVFIISLANRRGNLAEVGVSLSFDLTEKRGGYTVVLR